MWRMKVIFSDGTEEVFDERYYSKEEAEYDYEELYLNWNKFLEYNEELENEYKGSPCNYNIWEE